MATNRYEETQWGDPDTVMDHTSPVAEAWVNYYKPGTKPREARAFKAGFAAAEHRPITDEIRYRLFSIVREARRVQYPEYPNASTDNEVVDAILSALGTEAAR